MFPSSFPQAWGHILTKVKSNQVQVNRNVTYYLAQLCIYIHDFFPDIQATLKEVIVTQRFWFCNLLKCTSKSIPLHYIFENSSSSYHFVFDLHNIYVPQHVFIPACYTKYLLEQSKIFYLKNCFMAVVVLSWLDKKRNLENIIHFWRRFNCFLLLWRYHFAD